MEKMHTACARLSAISRLSSYP